MTEREAQASGQQYERSRQENLKTGWKSTEFSAASRCGVYSRPGFDWSAADVYLFDIDGTLLNSRDAVHYHAFHRAISRVFGLDLLLDGIAVHGNTDVGILRAYLEAAGVAETEWRSRIDEVLDLITAEVEHNASDLRPEICPAIVDVLRWFRHAGKTLGVASGNLERVGWAKLRACGLRDFFSFGAFSGAVETRDEVIANGVAQAKQIRGMDAAVFVVGDTPADILSAHFNGLPAIAVATGIYNFEELLTHDPDMCVSCCADLLQQLLTSNAVTA
jgi:phosphoglycolate phosphatase-like HAD superfamily hydrolase